MRALLSRYSFALLVLLVGATLSAPAFATPGECQRAIIGNYRSYAVVRMKTVQFCEDKVVKGQLPVGTDCQTGPDVALKLAAAEQKFRHHVSSACGGNNHTCNAADTGQSADETLASIGWDIGACPDIEGSGCANPIADCNDIEDCLVCLTVAAEGQAIALDYGSLNVPTSDRKLEACQREIGKRSAEFLEKKLKALARCERKVLAGDFAGPCPDPGTVQTIATLDAKIHAKVCNKCGGANKVCGGGDDRTPTEIGSVASCPGVTVPGGASCAGAIATVDDITTCANCVGEFKDDCLDAALVPALESYPTECNP